MNTSQARRKQEHPGLLTVRLELAASPEMQAHCPPGNWIGMMLLHRLLKVSLTARLAQAPEVACWGELTHSRCLISACNLRAALEVVIGELRELGLLGFAHLAWLDVDENVWRTHPAGRPGPDLLSDAVLDRAGAQAAREEILSIAALLRASAARIAREAGGRTDHPRQ